MSALKVLALDLSLAATGWAAADVATAATPVIRVGTVKPGKLVGDERVRYIVGQAHALRTAYTPDITVIERKLAAPGRTGTALDLAELHGVVRFYFAGRVVYVYVQQAKIKIYATGSGAADKGKTGVALAIERRYGGPDGIVRVEDDNQADAFTMAAMTCHHYGLPLAAVPQTHARGLAGIDWPTLPGFTNPEPGPADKRVRGPARPTKVGA